MDVYFDFPNFLSLIHSSKDSRYRDCMRMLRDKFDIKFTFSKESIYEKDKNDQNDIFQWFTTMGYGSGNVLWDSPIPHNPIIIDELKKVPFIQSVYCLDESSREGVDALINKGIIIVSKKGNELASLSGLFVDTNQYTKNVFNQIKKWEDIGKYTSPCSDIIVVDQYLFSSPDIYNSNIYQLVASLAESVKNEKVNIVFITQKKIKDFEPDWDDIYSKIRFKVNKKCRPNVTFVIASGDNLEHDRTIFTNYKFFSSGDSFNYFNNNGEKITKGRYLHIHSLADSDNMDDATILLNDIQKLIDKLKVLNNSYIMKDKKCNFLEF